MKSEAVLYDSFGNRVDSAAQRLTSGIPTKQAYGLVGNIYNGQNASSYRHRNYSLQDNNSGLDSVSRELVARWSREMREQLPFVDAAITLKAEYVVGEDGYFPTYNGGNSDWWTKYAEPFLRNMWMPSACIRGGDFQTNMEQESEWLDIDGDFLCEYAQPGGFPQFNIIPSNRIRSAKSDNYIYTEGNLKDCMTVDGVVYDMDGSTKGWNVKTQNNLVSSVGTETDTFQSTGSAQLIYHSRYFDKNRGLPTIGSGILSAISLQELYSYLEEKAKVESCVAMKEHTPTGEAPANLADQMRLLKQIQAQANNGSITTPVGSQFGVQIVQGPTTRFLKANGGELQFMAGETTGETTLEFIQRIEGKILSLIGIPQQFLYTTEQATGKISDVVMINFHKQILRRRKLLDRHAKFLFAWALSVAMKNKIIPKNNSENIAQVIGVTHAELPDANKYYSDEMLMKQIESGVAPIEKATQHFCKMTPVQVNAKNEAVALDFFKRAKNVSDTTEVDINTVISYMRDTVTKRDTAVSKGEQRQESQPDSKN